MEEDIFKKCEIDFNKLIDYGFIIEKNINILIITLS